MQEKYVKSTLANVNFRKFAEDQLKKVQTAKWERFNRYKLGNRVVQKGEAIIVEKTQKKFADKRANNVAIA